MLQSETDAVDSLGMAEHQTETNLYKWKHHQEQMNEYVALYGTS